MTKKPVIEKYVKKALKYGVSNAWKISTDTIVAEQWVRMKCQFGCDCFGLAFSCPPHSPTPEQTAKMLKCYQSAILLHGNDEIKLTKAALKLEREVFLDGYYKAFAMVAGPCERCEECNVNKGECRHPGEVRPSMEACGIDVYKMVHNNDLPLKVVRNKKQPPNYYSVVLVE